MKKFMLTAALIVFVGAATFAQVASTQKAPKPKPSSEERAQKQTAEMTNRLGLDKAQQQKIEKINAEATQKMEALKAGNEHTKQAHQSIEQEREKQILAVLNEKQKTEFEKMKQERKEKMALRKDAAPHKEVPAKN